MPKCHLLCCVNIDLFCRLFWKIHTRPVYHHHIFSLMCMILHEAKESRALQFLSAGVNTLQPLPLSFYNQKLWVQHEKQLPENSEKWKKKSAILGGEPKLREAPNSRWTSQVILFSFTLSRTPSCFVLEQDTIRSSRESNRAAGGAAAWTAKSSNETLSLGQRNLEKDPWRPEYSGNHIEKELWRRQSQILYIPAQFPASPWAVHSWDRPIVAQQALETELRLGTTTLRRWQGNSVWI